jgi:PAS domain S-box-containing protein
VEQRIRRGLQLVSTVVRTFSERALDYERLLPAIAWAIADAIPDTCLVSLCDEGLTSVTPVAAYDADPAIIDKLAPFRRTYQRTESALGNAAIESGSIFEPVLDLEAMKSRAPNAAAMFSAVDARGYIITPMRAGGELFGLITIIRRRPEHAPLDALDLEIVEDLAGHAALAIMNARLVKKLASGEKLRETTQFLDAIIENIPDMVFVKEADRLSFVRFNRAGEKLLGVAAADLIGKNDYDFFPLTEADFFTQKDRETLANKQLVEISEEPIQTRSGTRWLHTKKVPLLDDTGTPRYLLGISHDITERKRSDALLRAAKETVENANKELEAFAYSIAHDLRAPLRGILGYSEALLEDAADKLDGKPREYLTRMKDAASRMATLIEELLGLARVTQADLVRSRVDLTAIAYSTLGGLQAGTKDRKVDVVIQPNLYIDADPHMIAIVVENLLDNAWKFTSKRDGARIEIGQAGNTFYVRDNGAGFDPQYADQLFGVFRRLHMQEDFEGTGIGLATVARIIHRHNGHVWAEGQLGKGATFFFTVGDVL